MDDTLKRKRPLVDFSDDDEVEESASKRPGQC